MQRSALATPQQSSSTAIQATIKSSSVIAIDKKHYLLEYDQHIVIMKFQIKACQLLLAAHAVEGFQIHGIKNNHSATTGFDTSFAIFPSKNNRSSKKTNPIFSSTLEDQDAASSPKPTPKAYIKKEREAIAKKPDFYRGAGVFKEVKAGVAEDMREQFDSQMMNQMKEDPNYMLEKDGVEFYLAKDHGFCWGGELKVVYWIEPYIISE